MKNRETALRLHLLNQQQQILRDNPQARIWLVIEGDWGGQIYLTVPWMFVGESAEILRLAQELDRIAWSCNEGDGLIIQLYTTDDAISRQLGLDECLGVPGGMGGGLLDEFDLWLHREFHGQPVSILQDVMDARRGITCDDIREMDWNAQARRMLDLHIPERVSPIAQSATERLARGSSRRRAMRRREWMDAANIF